MGLTVEMQSNLLSNWNKNGEMEQTNGTERDILCMS